MASEQEPDVGARYEAPRTETASKANLLWIFNSRVTTGVGYLGQLMTAA